MTAKERSAILSKVLTYEKQIKSFEIGRQESVALTKAYKVAIEMLNCQDLVVPTKDQLKILFIQLVEDLMEFNRLILDYGIGYWTHVLENADVFEEATLYKKQHKHIVQKWNKLFKKRMIKHAD